MKKRFLLLAVLLTLSAVFVAPVAALPPGPYYYWGKIGRARALELPSLPPLVIEALDIKISTPIAPHDSVGISLYIPELDDSIPLVFVTDNEDCADLLKLMFGPALPWVPVVFVDESDLEIRACVTVALNVPVVGVMPDGTEVTIPSFNMKLRGGGRLEWIGETTVLPYYTMWVGAWACSATGIIIIDGCECQIGEASVGHYMMTITENP